MRVRSVVTLLTRGYPDSTPAPGWFTVTVVTHCYPVPFTVTPHVRSWIDVVPGLPRLPSSSPLYVRDGSSYPTARCCCSVTVVVVGFCLCRITHRAVILHCSHRSFVRCWFAFIPALFRVVA